jgi:NAD(P)-dependent dehydrogenase (short-subunit alcohol dehydrogenase family)
MADISPSALEKATTKIASILPTYDGKLLTFKCDVTQESEVASMIALAEPLGGVDIIFNNAGIMHAKDDDATNTPEAIWDLTMNINVKGVWFGCKHAVLSFRKNGKKRASVINTASVVALVGSATPQLAYTASKGAVLALTRELAVVHAKEGFRFNALCPAPLKYVDGSELKLAWGGVLTFV